MALLRLSENNRLCLKTANGTEEIQSPTVLNALLLVDTSGSMAGDKINQAKRGAVDFSVSATKQGYATALAVFADRAAMVCDPTTDTETFSRKIQALEVGIVGGTTDLAQGLVLANKFPELSAVVVVTDGATNNNAAALDVAASLKMRGIEIICIGTDDADRPFLSKLATRSDLAVHVSSRNLQQAVSNASRLLSVGKRVTK